MNRVLTHSNNVVAKSGGVNPYPRAGPRVMRMFQHYEVALYKFEPS
jgi:hypothetical protein